MRSDKGQGTRDKGRVKRSKRSRKEKMKTVPTLRLLAASLFLCSCFAAAAMAQVNNPFAPKPAPPLPAGMTGSDVNDPRYKLTPGMYDAGETASGLKLLKMM